MGKIFILPLRFILFFLISTAVFLAFSLIYYWGQWFSPAIDAKNSIFMFLPLSAFNILLPSVSSGLLFTFFSYRRGRINPAAILITAAAAFAIIFFGLSLTFGMKSRTDTAVFQPFNPRMIQVTENGTIYTDSISSADPTLIGGVIIRDSDEIPGFMFYPEAKLATGNNPYLEINSVSRIAVSPRNPVFDAIFRSGGVLADYIDDIEYLNLTFKEALGQDGLQYLLLTSAFSIFLLSCFLFRGATVWPLFDFILILGLHRLGYYLFSLLSKEASFISETLFGGRQGANIPLYTIWGFTVVILLCGLLLKLTSGRKAA